MPASFTAWQADKYRVQDIHQPRVITFKLSADRRQRMTPP